VNIAMMRARGFSLIELMIAVTLGMLAVAAVGSVFIYGSRNYKQDDKVSRLQDELRFAMAQLGQDLEMAGFFAQVRNLQDDIDVHASATINRDCGPSSNGAALGATNTWAYHNTRATVFTLGDATSALAAARFPCINNDSGEDEFVDGTDIIAIKRLAGSAITPTASNNDEVLLRTNGVQFWIYRHGAAPTLLPQTTPASVTVYPVRPVVWYIRKYAFEGQNPPVPSLCRQYLVKGNGTDPPAMTPECVAQGIEDMQFEFGFDDDSDGIVDYFDPIGDLGAPLDNADYNVLTRIIAVRIFLLARSAEEDVDYKGSKAAKTFSLGQGYTPRSFPSDGYYRKVLSSVVLLRNPSNRLTPYELPQ
jgi:type IV pilus assembly protein PilW